MRVRMLETTDGSPDGMTVRTYRKGETYDIPESLARIFFERGVADTGSGDPRKRETKPMQPPETKPAEPDETKEGGDDEGEVSVTKERTTPKSPYYQFRANGDLITDSSGEVVKVLGEENAERRRKEMEANLNA